MTLRSDFAAQIALYAWYEQVEHDLALFIRDAECGAR